MYSRSTVLLLCIFISSDISFIIDVVGSIWYYDKDFLCWNWEANGYQPRETAFPEEPPPEIRCGR